MAQLIDSAAFSIRLAGEPVSDLPEVQLGVAFPRTPGPPEVWVTDSAVTPDAQARLAELVRSVLRPQGVPPGTTLRIHVRVTTPVTLRVERSVLCAPVPLDSPGSTQPSVQVIDGVRPALPRRMNAGIRQRIGADGQVLDARLQPGSGRPELDRVALLPVFSRRWRPATLDGRPVEVWLANGQVELAR
jgi:hypothetical protein